MDGQLVIRALEERDWAVLRGLRLCALEESPDSFGPTHESALARPDEYWRGWARGTAGTLQAWAAFRRGEPVGLVSGGVRERGTGHFGALWVAPAERGSGLGARLVETVCAWLEANGCTRIELEVTGGNPAGALYERLGFRATGQRHPLRPGSPLFEATMAREAPARPGSA